MLRIYKYILPLSLFVLVLMGCAEKQFRHKEEKPLGIVADADSIAIFQHRVNNLGDSLTLNNLVQIQSFYYNTKGYLIAEKTIGMKNGEIDYESFCEILRDDTHHITMKSTTLKDHFGERNIIETYLKRSKMDEIIETKYYMTQELVTCDTTRISYSSTRTLKESCKNKTWSKISEQIYENEKIKENYLYLGDNINRSTKYSYDANGRLRTSQSYVHNVKDQSPLPQPAYTYTYIVGADGNPEQQVTVLGGILLSISEIKIHDRAK